jgi:hypothetical protein
VTELSRWKHPVGTTNWFVRPMCDQTPWIAKKEQYRGAGHLFKAGILNAVEVQNFDG